MNGENLLKNDVLIIYVSVMLVVCMCLGNSFGIIISMGMICVVMNIVSNVDIVYSVSGVGCMFRKVNVGYIVSSMMMCVVISRCLWV